MALGDWEDGADGATPLSAERLLERDTAIEAAAETATWDGVSGKPAVIGAGADAAAARTAIGAGTSTLALGSSGSTAAAGNHVHTATQVTATAVGAGSATTVQGILEELHARIDALENP